MSKPELKDGAGARPNSPSLAKNETKVDDDDSSDSFQHIGGDPKSAANTKKEDGKGHDKPKDKDKDAAKKKPDATTDPRYII
jgi:hypothetical protein